MADISAILKDNLTLIAGTVLTCSLMVGCQRMHTQRVALEHTGITLSPEPTRAQLASNRSPVDPSTALRLASLGIAID